MTIWRKTESIGVSSAMAIGLAWGGWAVAVPLETPSAPANPAPAARSAHQAFDAGNRYMKERRFHEAAAAFQEAVRARPDFAEAHSNLGYALRNSGRVDEAIASYTEAIRLKPDLAEAHEYLGGAYLMKGDRQAALEQHRILQRLNPTLAAELLEEIQRHR